MIECVRPGVQAIAFTPAEFQTAMAKGNPLAREALDSGVPLAGDAFFAARRAAAS